MRILVRFEALIALSAEDVDRSMCMTDNTCHSTVDDQNHCCCLMEEFVVDRHQILAGITVEHNWNAKQQVELWGSNQKFLYHTDRWNKSE